MSVLVREAGAQPLTVASARRALAEQLQSAGIESPELDALILIGHALGLDHAALATAGTDYLDSAKRDAIAALARRRLAREPVARIVGVKEFWSLPLAVDPATLVPRPETETVVEAALTALDANNTRTQNLRIADLGTGTGALLLALLAELPNTFGVGTDISPGALYVACANARRLKSARAHFVACDLASAIDGPFDLVVSNPPYVASGAIATLAADVRDFDPRIALDGGPDGLACYRKIAAGVPPILKPGGILVVELGAGQARSVATLLLAAGLAPLPPRNDLNNVARALVARKAL